MYLVTINTFNHHDIVAERFHPTENFKLLLYTFLDHNFTLDIFTKINNFHDCLQFDISHRKRLTTHFVNSAAWM